LLEKRLRLRPFAVVKLAVTIRVELLYEPAGISMALFVAAITAGLARRSSTGVTSWSLSLHLARHD
jgi:hypothetical protein